MVLKPLVRKGREGSSPSPGTISPRSLENHLNPRESAERILKSAMKSQEPKLTDQERGVIEDCLRAAVSGPFFPEEEFHTIFGLTRDELTALSHRWPKSANWEPQMVLAVNNTLNNLLGYPHREEKSWPKFISASPEAVADLYAKCRKIWDASGASPK